MKRALCVSIASALFLVASEAHASRQGSNKTVSVNGVAGVPELIGLQVGYEGWFPFRAALAFGLFPVNGILNSLIPMSRQQVSFAAPDNYYLYPSAIYSLTSFGANVKYHFGGSGFFASLMAANLYFSTSFSASLQNDTTKGTISNAISGSATIIQPMIGLTVGYEIAFNFGGTITFAAGAAIPIATIANSSLSGTAAQAAPALTGGDTSFNNARVSFQAALDSAIASYRSLLPVFPVASVQFGWLF